MNSTFIIAEAGVNHNGSLDMALRLVDKARAAGVDAVKFQTFKSEAVISRFAAKAEYQKSATGVEESQLDMVRKLELSDESHHVLRQHCIESGIQFLSTPFDIGSARFLVREMNVACLKIPSGEITNGPFLVEIGRLDRPVILSTGMSTLGEVETALGALAFGYLRSGDTPSEAVFRDVLATDAARKLLTERVELLHCTTEYPTPYDQVNLLAMDVLAKAFGLPVGLSDHTEGIAVAIAAVARGARIIEKHFTLDKTLPGPDHRASLEPDELVALVKGIRQIEQALGTASKRPSSVEWGNRSIARRSLVAACNVQSGDVWSEKNLTVKRPGDGISPMRYWEMLGRRATRDFGEDEPIG